MKTIVAILLANVLILGALAALANHGELPLSPKALVARRNSVQLALDEASLRFARMRPPEQHDDRGGGNATAASQWSEPLVDRVLSQTEKGEGIAPDLTEAIARMEPIYDPTRLDTPLERPWHVSAGTASTFDVFGERWHLASDDANVNATVRTIGLAWGAGGTRPCEGYTKTRRHDFGEPSLTAMSASDCQRLRRWRADDAAPVPVVAAALDLPAFLAPEPGNRMSSEAFWKAQQTRIAAIQSHLHRKWQDPSRAPIEVGSTR